MPNGGSDCCGTCWFNRKNQGEAGYAHADDPGLDYCEIREIDIRNAFWTYCANHPHRSPWRDQTPIGPVLIDEGDGRQIWLPTPDTEQVRQHLLDLAAGMQETPLEEYTIGVCRDELVIWQLGELREQRAVDLLQRIQAFDPETSIPGPFGRTRHSLVQAARDALSRINNSH